MDLWHATNLCQAAPIKCWTDEEFFRFIYQTCGERALHQQGWKQWWKAYENLLVSTLGTSEEYGVVEGISYT